MNNPNAVWSKKALAFLVRSRQELWGKHNEDMLAWFFREGFSNRFIQDMLLGWNRIPQIRPAAAWGFPENENAFIDSRGKFTLPPGIVIPWVVDQNLKKLLIHDHTSQDPDRLFTLLGSACQAMVLGEGFPMVTVVFNVIHALLVHQDYGNRMTVVIPDHRACEPDPFSRDVISKAETLLFFSEERFTRRDQAIVSKWETLTDKGDWVTYPSTDQLLDRLKAG